MTRVEEIKHCLTVDLDSAQRQWTREGLSTREFFSICLSRLEHWLERVPEDEKEEVESAFEKWGAALYRDVLPF